MISASNLLSLFFNASLTTTKWIIGSVFLGCLWGKKYIRVFLFSIIIVLVVVTLLVSWNRANLHKAEYIASLPIYSSGSDLVFVDDGHSLLLSVDGKAILWDLAHREQKTLFDGDNDKLSCFAVGPGGTTVATCDCKGRVSLRDLMTGKHDSLIQINEAKTTHAVAFSPDGKLLAITGRWKPPSTVDGLPAAGRGEITLWDRATRGLKKTFIGHNGPVSRIMFAPDGLSLASASYDATIKLWDMETLEERATLSGHSGAVFTLSYSPDGKFLASGSYDGVRLWDAATGSQLACLKGWSGTPRCMVFSPNSKNLVVGCGDVPSFLTAGRGKVELWDVNGRHIRSRWEVNGLRVLAIALSPDGKTLATKSADGIIDLWSISNVSSW
ncbi:MAG TPA: WD40 repeat domain-containing protein [Gemmataceae bacterium]|jgi:WD40 repeat protein